MSVEFNENRPVNYGYQSQKGGLTNWFIKVGLAKNEKSAQIIMIILTIICFTLSFYFFYKAFQ